MPSEEPHHREAVDEATEPWICVHGHENVPDNIFCGKCGCPRERPVWPAVDPTVTHHIDEELAVEQVEPGTPEPHIRVKSEPLPTWLGWVVSVGSGGWEGIGGE